MFTGTGRYGTMREEIYHDVDIETYFENEFQYGGVRQQAALAMILKKEMYDLGDYLLDLYDRFGKKR